jgi:branched-chain amino acid transport system ATP-binding protein
MTSARAPSPALVVEGLAKRFGGVVATDGVDLRVLSGTLHAIIGPNGAGKTTLLAQLAGSLEPDSGVVRLNGRDITHLPPYQRTALGLARSFQITNVFHDLSASQRGLGRAVTARTFFPLLAPGT